MIFIPDMDVKLAADPYLIWAMATNFRDYGNIGEDEWVSCVIECKDDETVRSFAARLKQSVNKNNPIWCKIPNLYLTNSARFATVRFCTIQVQRKNILKLQKEVKRFELGMPVNPNSADSVLETTINDQYIPVNNSLVVGIIDDFLNISFVLLSTFSATSLVCSSDNFSICRSSGFWIKIFFTTSSIVTLFVNICYITHIFSTISLISLRFSILHVFVTFPSLFLFHNSCSKS